MPTKITSLATPPSAPATLGERVAFLMEKRGISQHGIEGEAKLSRGYISRVVKGERMKLSPEILRRIADVLEVNYEWLATGRGEMEGGGTGAPVGADLSHPLEAAIAYHRGKWTAPAIAAARALTKHPEAADLEPPDWADVLDQLEAAVSKVKLTGRRRSA
ncbi:helix-turn-helix domain-containing protein [Sorangium sp. So ce406]|uniref:helix-turn-helix domain-containing protein n=1 Tax=Sorangium sp. So ce406 TaxID=3133311 RepID=UPI003F5BECA0